MSEPFLAEIRPFAFNFAPRGWALCDGQLLPINQNQALFSLLGTTYGGDGRITFALPDLRGRSPMHLGAVYSLGVKSGADNTTLNSNQLPTHNHFFMATTTAADSPGPEGNLLASPEGHNIYGSSPNVILNDAIAPVGGNQPFQNL